jgi:hypothetical protein
VTAWWVAQRLRVLVVAALLEAPMLYMGEPAEHERNEFARMAALVRDLAAAWQRAGASVAEVSETIAAAPFRAGSLAAGGRGAPPTTPSPISLSRCSAWIPRC